MLARNHGLATWTGIISRASLLVSEHVTVFDVESIMTFEAVPHVADWLESPIGTGCVHNLRTPEAAAGTWEWTSHCSTFKTNWQVFVKPFRLAEIFCGGSVGWAHAVRVPDPIIAPIHTVAANDLGLGVATAYSHTRGATLFNQCSPQGPTTSAPIEPQFGWHADICTSNWHADFGMISVNNWAVSSICTGWSEPGSKAGLLQQGRRNVDAGQRPGSHVSAAIDHLRTRGRFQRSSPIPSRLRALEQCRIPKRDGAFDLADAPTVLLHSSTNENVGR